MNVGDRVKILAGDYAGKLGTIKYPGQYVVVDGAGTASRPYRESNLELVTTVPTGPAPSLMTVNALGMPTVPGAPSLAPPRDNARVVRAGSDDIVDALAGAVNGEEIVLDGGDHSLPGVNATLRASNVTVRSMPGEVARVVGSGQLRIYGTANALYEVFVDTRKVPGKHLDIIGSGHKIWRNKLDTGHTGSPGGYGTCAFCDGASAISFEGNWFKSIGNLDDTNIFDHAIYAQGLDRSVIRRNMFTDVTGGYCFHGYDGGGGASATNCVFEHNLIWNSYGVIGATGSSNNRVFNNAFQWDLSSARRAPVASVYKASGLIVVHNAVYTAAKNWGDDGIAEGSGLSSSDNLVAKPQFVDPANGDMRIGNAAVREFLGV